METRLQPQHSFADLNQNGFSGQRQDDRKAVCIRVLCHAHGSFSTVQIYNISCGGAALRECKSLMPGDIVQIEFLDRRKLNAKVRWWLNGKCGIQFTSRIASDDFILQDKIR